MSRQGFFSLVLAAFLTTACTCGKEQAAHEGEAPSVDETPVETVPAWRAAESPDEALEELFDALVARDEARIADALVSDAQCAAITAGPQHCDRVRLQREAFIHAMREHPVPSNARIAGVLLQQSIELPAGRQGLTQAVRIQPAVVRFQVPGAADSTLGNLAVMEVPGGWRVVPGRPVIHLDE